MRIVCAFDKCTGCLACVVSCMDHHYPADAHDAVSPRRYSRTVRQSGLTQYRTDSCRHCVPARCMEDCPVRAIVRGEDGWVRVDRSLCVGCGRCLKACPFAIPRLDNQKRMVKCDGCGGDPNCVRCCPNGALSLDR